MRRCCGRVGSFGGKSLFVVEEVFVEYVAVSCSACRRVVVRSLFGVWHGAMRLRFAGSREGPLGSEPLVVAGSGALLLPGTYVVAARHARGGGEVTNGRRGFNVWCLR